MSNVSDFPFYIRAVYEEGDVFDRFQRDVSNTVEATKQRFEKSFAEIGSIVSKAISRPAGVGQLDLGLPEFRQAAAEARAYQATLEVMLSAARQQAQATGDQSSATRSYIQALMAQNSEAKEAVSTAEAQVATYTRLQAAMNGAAEANSRLAQAQRELYAEQAAAARLEVTQRQRQQGLNEVFAPGLTRRAIDSGAGFSALAEMVRQQDEAVAGQKALAVAAAQLRSELDPMFAAQQRFNAALDRAEELYRGGAITLREYEQAQIQARGQLQEHAQALFRVEQATSAHTAATGAQRAAMINASQQLQDVTVQLASGQRASVVFAQQLPQLGFALSGLEGSTNKTAARLGALGTFLAGPWGVAVFAGATALGFLAEHLSRTSDRLDETASAAEKSAGRIRSALENLQAYGQTASEMSRLFTDSTDVRIKAAEKDAKAARLELDAQQAREEANRKGIGIDREYRQAALRRAESAETRAKALRSEANADRATADATLRAAAQKERAQAVLDGMNGTATGSTRRGGGATIDREARAAAKEIDQLESKIQSLESRLDPATSAAREFADALEAINAAAAKGLITPGRAQELSTAAIFEDDRRQKAAEAADVGRFLQIYRPIDLDGLVESSEAYSRRIAEKWKDSQRDAAREFASALQSVDIARSLVSGRGIAGIGRGLASGQLNLGNPEFADAFAKAFKDGVKGIEEAFSGALKDVLGPDSAKVGEALGKGFLGAQIGGMTSDLLEGIGLQNSKLGSQIGGAIGSAFGPIGSLIGSVIGGVGIEALKPTKRGSATIGGSGTNLIVASSRGNSRQRVKASVETADEAITTLERIAEALGGRIDGSRGSVSIGVRGDSFRVDTSGRGITKTKKGAVDFGDDSAAAIRFATLDLIQDGVVQGIRASTQRVLQSGKDLESAIARAVDFQSVFDRLQERVDPVGAAITRVDREFARLRDIFGEAAASAEEYADLEKLFQLERADAIREANDRVLGSMKALLDDLQFGDNGRSLRDRLAAAQAKFDPLMGRVQAGDLSAYDDFTEAARALLDIQRQFSGSQTAFFKLQDEITAITAKAVGSGNAASILASGGSARALSAQADAQRAFDGSNVVSAIERQTQELGDILLRAVGGELRAIREEGLPGPVSGGRVDIPGFFVQNIRQV